MSESVAKAARRDLRRAVGLEAAGVLDAHSTVLEQQVLPNLQVMQTRVVNVDDRLKIVERRVGTTRSDLEVVARDLAAFRHRSLRARLRWLLTGA